jgi:hypothetical protein
MRIFRRLLARLRRLPDMDDPDVAEQARRQAEASTLSGAGPVRMDSFRPPH